MAKVKVPVLGNKTFNSFEQIVFFILSESIANIDFE